MSAYPCRLGEAVQGVPVFKIYGEHLSVKPRQLGKPLLDMGQEFVTVCRYPIPVPPVHYVPGKLPAALYILAPLVVIA